MCWESSGGRGVHMLLCSIAYLRPNHYEIIGIMQSHTIVSNNAPETVINLLNVTKISYARKEMSVCYNSPFGFFVLGSGTLDNGCDKFSWNTKEEAESEFNAMRAKLNQI
jgi:hypothetical protein